MTNRGGGGGGFPACITAHMTSIQWGVGFPACITGHMTDSGSELGGGWGCYASSKGGDLPTGEGLGYASYWNAFLLL